MNACRARICSSTSSDRVPSAERPRDRRRDRGSQVSLVQDRGQPGSSLFRVRLLSYLPTLCIRVHICLHVVGHERADKPEHWRGATAKAATTGEPGEDDDQRRHTPGRGTRRWIPKAVRDYLAAIGARGGKHRSSTGGKARGTTSRRQSGDGGCPRCTRSGGPSGRAGQNGVRRPSRLRDGGRSAASRAER